MPRRLVPGLALLLAASLASAAPAPQKYRLQDAAAVGDASTTDQSMTMGIDLTLLIGGSPAQTLKYGHHDQEKYTEWVLRMTGDRPTYVRRTYTVARSLESAPGADPKRTVFTRQGKTITLRQQGPRVVLSSPKGALAAAEAKELQSNFKPSGFTFFPAHAVAVGEEWTVDPAKAAKFFPGTTKAEMKGRLEEIVQRSGHPCARVRVTLDLQAEGKEYPGPLKASLEGDLFHAVDIHRTVALHLTGPITMKGKIEQEGASVDLDGDGTMDMSWTSQWLKVAGKPVTSRP
jgi:hypothetical protein